AETGDIIDTMFGAGTITMAIGGLVCTVTPGTFAGGEYDITVGMTCPAGSSLIGELEKAIADADDGDVGVSYNGTKLTLTKEQVHDIIEILKLLYERHHP
ncbi:MAG: hypothetical protein LBH69_03410, partial [Methanomassiliicoccaceae archaeon]|nr:hypothetical protein [Methanomassiliicoccaceae archaeon]